MGKDNHKNNISIDKKIKGKRKSSWFQSLSAKLYGGLALFTILILVISIFSWRSLLEVVNVQEILVTENIPELILATSIVQQSERLISLAPQLINSVSEEELKSVHEKLKTDDDMMKRLLSDLEQSNLSKKNTEIYGLVTQMTDNLYSIEKSVSQKKKLLFRIQKISNEITELSRTIHTILVTEVDDKTFDLAIKSKSIESQGRETTENMDLKEILLYRQLLNLQSQVNISVNLLRETAGLSDADLIQPTRERFVAAIESCEHALSIFPENYKELVTHIQSLKKAGLNQSTKLGMFELKKNIIDIEGLQSKYLRQNRMIAGQLAENVRNVNLNIKIRSSEASQLFQKSLTKNKTLFLIINVLSFVGALIVAFFFVGPLVRKLTYLSREMRSMSRGDLENEIVIKGNDEVKEMGDALEIFRRHALEVQRLNLVEKLAKKVQEKNKILEKTIKDLHKTRNQLMIQEKLASLGQLTSGIAHEIKNPLNFINNFSKISSDIVVDLNQEFKNLNNQVKKDNLDFIKQLIDDLKSNMEKINIHGDRANDIITGMLQHSRGSAGHQEFVDINKYMDTYSNLAFHSKRSLDSNFTVSFKKDYDKNLQPIMAVPQDISRVILNIITNACDAVTEKKQNAKSYIWLKTRKEGNNVKIIIKDNGPGIPSSIREKIFNPFFTTKPTGRGTGLGLSLVHDIVTKYDGTLTVKSKENEFTEFTVILPIKKEST